MSADCDKNGCSPVHGFPPAEGSPIYPMSFPPDKPTQFHHTDSEIYVNHFAENEKRLKENDWRIFVGIIMILAINDNNCDKSRRCPQGGK